MSPDANDGRDEESRPDIGPAGAHSARQAKLPRRVNPQIGDDGSESATAGARLAKATPAPNVWRRRLSLTARLAAGWMIAAALTFCAPSDAAAPKPETRSVPAVVATSVQIVLPRNTLEVGDSMVVVAVVLDANGGTIPNQTAEWSSANPAIVQISQAGVVRAVAPGVTSITVKVGRLASTAEIQTFVPVVATSVQIVLPRNTLDVGDSMLVVAVVLDANGGTIPNQTAEWSSANPAIVQVSPAGVVTAVAPGVTSITVKVGRLAATAEIQTFVPSALLSTPELPRRYLDTKYVVPTGRVRQVRAGENLQHAIDIAERGDVIELEPGAVFTGNFTLPAKPGTGWITIRTAAPDADLSPEGTRIGPSVHGAALARLQTASAKSVITTQPGASGYRLVGLEITARDDIRSLYALVQFGDGGLGQRDPLAVPSDLILDRSYVHGHENLNLQRCVALNSASSAIIDSYLSMCHAKGLDSQAIAGWNGPGPYKIVNNYLEGAGENVMFGGADSSIPDFMPSDIEIRANHFYKPLAWKGLWTVKNLLEIKAGRRILIQGNVFEHCWTDGQTGFALVFKSVNQGGQSPWSQTSDVTFRYNVVRRTAAGVSIAARPAQYPALPAARFVFEHNVFAEVGDFAGTQNGRMFMLLQDLQDIEIRSNTLLHNAEAGQFILFTDAGPARGFVVRDNIATKGGPWGAVMGTAPQGAQALAAFARTYTFARNVVIGLPNHLIRLYPSDNFYVSSVDLIGFADLANGDYSLTPSSQYFGVGTGSSNPGADWARVAQETRGVVISPP